MRLQLGDDLIVRLHDHRILRGLRLHEHRRDSCVGVASMIIAYCVGVASMDMYEILRRMFVLEGRQRRSRCFYTILYDARLYDRSVCPVDHRVLDNEVKLISARPGNLTAFALLWLKTRRLGRFL